MLIMHIDIVDLGSGNVRSIENIVTLLNLPAKSVSKPSEISSSTLILPGVGSAGPYMEKIKTAGFDIALKEHAESGKNLIGICLGYQLMTDYSEEDGGVEGLGLIKGHAERLINDNNTCSHNGWESFTFRKKLLSNANHIVDNNLTRKQNVNGRVFYNHEYGVICEDDTAINLDISDTLKKYTAMTLKKNIIGMQFHPEKSQNTGLDLLAMLL